MTNILVICGAGASSSFLVHWLRRQAEARGIDSTFTPGALETLTSDLQSADAVLVGSHLAESFGQVLAAASGVPVPATLLPAVTFDAAGADLVLDLLATTETETASHA